MPYGIRNRPSLIDARLSREMKRLERGQARDSTLARGGQFKTGVKLSNTQLTAGHSYYRPDAPASRPLFNLARLSSPAPLARGRSLPKPPDTAPFHSFDFGFNTVGMFNFGLIGEMLLEAGRKLIRGTRGLDFTQGNVRVASLDKKPGPEFGKKAQNLGIMSASRKTKKMTLPGAVILDAGNASDADRIVAIKKVVEWLEERTGTKFGASDGKPLLLAVRSSPLTSAPGVAKSVIYVGINDATRAKLAELTSQEVADRTYSAFAKGLPAGKDVPSNPLEQLLLAVKVVEDSMKTAGLEGGVIIQQAAVIDDSKGSGAGVYFTRSPSDGSKTGSARFAANESGAEVVTGDAGKTLDADSPTLSALDRIRRPLEKLFGDALDVEFAIVGGALILLQARSMRFNTPEVQVHVWEDMVRGGLMAAGLFPKKVVDLQNETPSNVFVVKTAAQLGEPVGRGNGINKLFAAQGKLATTLDEPAVLFVDDPSDTAVQKAMWEGRVLGIVTPSGHEFSHVAILARALKIPMLIGFSGDVSSLIGKPVIVDERTGGLYEMTGGMEDILERSSEVDPRRYLGIDREEIEKEVAREVESLTVEALAQRHTELINESIKAAKNGDFQRAAYLTTKANLYHKELRKEPFTIYAWDNQISGIYSGIRPGETIEDAIKREAFNLDPTFKALKEQYGDRLRIAVQFNPQNYFPFFRISAIVADGGSPFIKRWEFIMAGGFGATSIAPASLEDTPSLDTVREEAHAFVAANPGTQYIEYDMVDAYHDRGLLKGRKIIGVLPAAGRIVP